MLTAAVGGCKEERRLSLAFIPTSWGNLVLLQMVVCLALRSQRKDLRKMLGDLSCGHLALGSSLNLSHVCFPCSFEQLFVFSVQ